MRSRIVLILALATTLAAFVFGMYRLFVLRFSRGDVYPMYSTLRADPLGAKALYEALALCPGVKVSRNFEHLGKLSGSARGSTLFLLGVDDDRWPLDAVQSVEEFCRFGGRVVIVYLPFEDKTIATQSPHRFKPAEQRARPRDDPKKKHRHAPVATPEEEEAAYIRPGTRWGFTLRTSPLADFVKGTAARREAGAPDSLPTSVVCHSPVFFEDPQPSWQVIYSRQHLPVLMRRPLGRGELVLSSLEYPLSNEALKKDRSTPYLAWLVGANPRLIFDEYHHGIMQQPGVAGLARKYHLEGLALGLIALATLFIWMNAVSLLPGVPGETSVRRAAALGKDSVAALVNLLRRNIAARQVVEACFEEWRKSYSHAGPEMESKLRAMNSEIESERQRSIRQRDPVRAYNALRQILGERKST